MCFQIASGDSCWGLVAGPMYRVVQKNCPLFKNSRPYCCHTMGPALHSPIGHFRKVLAQFSQLSAISFAQPCRFPFPQQGVNGQSVIDSRPKQQSCEGKRMRPSRTALSGEIPDVDRLDLSGTNTWPSWTAASPLSSHKFDKT